MVDAVGEPIPGWRRFETHEVALIALGAVTTGGLLATSHRSDVLLEVIAATIIYATTLLVCRIRTPAFSQKISFIASFAFAVWFYCAIARITPTLGTKLQDRTLLALDQTLFGQTPSVYCGRVAAPWLTDLMSLCYLTYHVYLAVVVVQAVRGQDVACQRLNAHLFMGFAIGFAGYLLVPAVGPACAYPELFRGPLPGGTLSRLIAQVIAQGSSGYDVFPSLHVLITCLLLDHDWRAVRRRFWMMAVPSLGLVVSTIYLRYHYAVDILMGFLLFLALRQTILKIGRREVGLPQ